MTWKDTLINTRENLLAGLLRFDRTLVLNPLPVGKTLSTADNQVAEDIKRAINAFKASAIDETGSHVDYVQLANSPAYAKYRAECSPLLLAFDPAQLATREAKLAFWINLYNAIVIDSVIAFGVQHSVTEGFAGILRFFRQGAYGVGGQRMAMEDIEHGILRGNRGNPYLPGPQFGPDDPRVDWTIPEPDPRVHFALNCASRSCPPIGIYTPDQIDRQLDLAAAGFIRQKVIINRKTGTVSLSQIFRWYQDDFNGLPGLIAFLTRFLAEEDASWLASHRDTMIIQYRPYDWSLNV